MHRILKSYLDEFSKNFEIGMLVEAILFERFVNFCVVSKKISTEFDPGEITTGNEDSGIDGIAVIIDEELILSGDDASLVFENKKKNHDVEIIFIQSKTTESFDLGDFLKFKEGVLSFIKEENNSSQDDYEINAHEIFSICLKNVSKIREGKPSVTIRYATSGNYQSPKKLENARHSFSKQLKETEYFSNIDVKIIGREEICKLWTSIHSTVEAKLPTSSNAAFPSIQGIEEAYLVVAKAIDVVKNLLTSEDGSIRPQIFEENVRSFLGYDNSVNESIAQTLKDKNLSTLFPVMNNGITIVGENVRVQGSDFHLENYQIVNGCQTSHILFENREILTPEIMVNLKIIKTTNEDLFEKLVHATNNQSEIKDIQLFSLSPLVKKIEKYFSTYNDNESKLYLERRSRQYIGKNIPSIRIFSVERAARCVAAMFLNRPDLSGRYPKKIYQDLGKKIFDEKKQ